MSTGQLWTLVATPTDVGTSIRWRNDTAISVQSGSGQRPVAKIYQRAAASWTLLYERDVTPPAMPLSLTATLSGSTLTMTAKAPADADMASIAFRWSTTGYPTSPTSGGGGSVAAGPSATVSASYANQTSGTVLYWAVFAIDTSGNYSTPRLLKYTVPTIASAPTTVTKSAYVYATDSASWNDVSGYWRTDNDYVYQGGDAYHGLWFYSTRISALLAKAKTIEAFSITITRANTVHGVPGGANVYLTAHTATAQPSGSPQANDSNGAYVGTLTRGQTDTFAVPSGYWASFLGGTYKGFGLYAGTTSYTDPKYLYALGGANAVSGRVYLKWTE